MKNRYLKNLKRIEFAVTFACTGRCKHCSEGDHRASGDFVKVQTAAKAVRDAAGEYDITEVMTFGGEALLVPETVYAIHSAAAEMGIPERQLITNGFFSQNTAAIKAVAGKLAQCGVNDLLVSADAFHQETIPLEPVIAFAAAAREAGIPVRVHPAWLVGADHENPYNRRTREILAVFSDLGISLSSGNDILPFGNARKYLGDYYDLNREYSSPYQEDPRDIRAVTIGPDGSVLCGNLYKTGLLEILEGYQPEV